MNKPTLIFDLDDTLIPSSEIYSVALKDIGVDPKGRPFQRARMKVKSQLPEKNPAARNRLHYFKELLTGQGLFSALEILKLTEKYETALQKRIRESWKQLGREKLFSLLCRDFSLSVITNENTRTQLIKLIAVDPRGKIFSSLTTSEEVGFEKPAASIFDLALRRMKNPKMPILIGDDIECDILPALNRGWYAILTKEFNKGSPKNFVQLKKVKQLKRLRVINKLEELPQALESIWS